MSCNSNEPKSNNWLKKNENIDNYVNNMFSPLPTQRPLDNIFTLIKNSKTNFVNLNSHENKDSEIINKISKTKYILKLGKLL